MGAAGQAAAMRYARWSAAAIIVGVGAAAFRLSYSTLKDLAVLAHIPARDAWLFPLIVDGTILLATFGVLVCPGRERRFFLSVLIVGSAVSVAGNSLHAVANGQPLPAWASAIVAAIAPISLLADTHGLAVLFRIAHRGPAADPVPEVPATATEFEPAPGVASVSEVEPVVAAGPAVSARKPARQRSRKASAGSSADRAARAVAMREAGSSVADIAAELGVSETTVRKYTATGKPAVTEPASVLSPASSPEPEPVRVADPIPAPVIPVRSRPVQQLLPIAVPVGG